MTVRLLALGDIHLGRRLHRVPESIAAQFGRDQLAPLGAWQRSVEHALARKVDAVLLAGDVVDREDDFFEAYGQLERGVQRLAQAGIPVVGVAGNHDVQVLPRLAASIERFVLLGQGGHWESCQIASSGGDSVRVVGWSFPRSEVPESPLRASGAGALLQRAAHPEPTIGLLHCDRDGRGHHAPVARGELDAAAVDAWLLGHVHRPDPLAQGTRPMGYLGSLVGLDPTETGPHGPWEIEVHHAGDVRARQIALAPLRWEMFDVRCGLPEPAGGGTDGPRDPAQWLEDVLPLALRRHVATLHDGAVGPRPLALGCRVRLVGRSAWGESLRRHLAGRPYEDLAMEIDGTVCFVDRVDLALAPPLPLAELARSRDPAGLLAARLLLLDGPAHHPERRRLIESARQALMQVRTGGSFSVLADSAGVPDDEAVAEVLRDAGRDALGALLEQVPGAAGTAGGGEPG